MNHNENDDAASADFARRGSNQSEMRAYNERLVLSLLRQTGPLAKAQIARRTGLSAQTVSVIMRALETEGLLTRGEPVRGKIGQPSVPMSLAKDGAFFFGVKVGRRSLDLVLTDFMGNVLHRVRSTHAYPTPDNTVRFVSIAVEEALAKLPFTHKSRIAGLGIALPFQLWDWADVLGAPIEDMQEWKDRNIAAEIEAAWQFPVITCNDASAACGAELVFGDQNRPSDFLYFFVGYFIGGGLVLDNGLYTGRTGNAAALGSTHVRSPDGALHQLVDVASLAALDDMLADQGDQARMIWETPETWNVPADPLESWLDSAAYGLAQAINSAVCLIDVGHVLIDGWMPQHMRAELVRHTEIALNKICMVGVEKPQIRAGTVGSDARALGAASLPLSNRFLVDRTLS